MTTGNTLCPTKIWLIQQYLWIESQSNCSPVSFVNMDRQGKIAEDFTCITHISLQQELFGVLCTTITGWIIEHPFVATSCNIQLRIPGQGFGKDAIVGWPIAVDIETDRKDAGGYLNVSLIVNWL